MLDNHVPLEALHGRASEPTMVRFITELSNKLVIVDVLFPRRHNHMGPVEIDDSVGFTSLDALVVLSDPPPHEALLPQHNSLTVGHL